MMKRILLALICVCVCVSICACSKRENPPDAPPTAAPTLQPAETLDALADDIPNVREIVGAPDVYQATWVSRTGKSTYSINASVVVPDVISFSLYEVKPRFFTSDEVLALTDVLFGAGNYVGDTEFHSNEQDPTPRMRMESIEYYKQYPAFFLTVHNGIYFIPNCSDSWLNFQRQQNYGLVWYSPQSAVRVIGNTAPGNKHTLDEAISIADDAINSFAPWLEFVRATMVRGEYYSNDKYDEPTVISDAYAYVLYYTRPYGGAPTTYTQNKPSKGDEVEPEFSYSAENEVAYVIVSNYGIEQLKYTSPHDTISVISENVPLLSFDEVITIAQTILPLKYASRERHMSLDYYIDRITLGYMRVMMRDSTNRYVMTPVWDFFSRYEYGMNPEESYLTINAIDGTIIDRSYGY